MATDAASDLTGSHIEVSHDEFFRTIGPQDVHPRVVGPYPYTSIFEDQRTRAEAGRIVDEGHFTSHYYLIASIVKPTS